MCKLLLEKHYTGGGAFISSLDLFVTSLCKDTISKAQPLCARATSCFIAVKKPSNHRSQLCTNILKTYLAG